MSNVELEKIKKQYDLITKSESKEDIKGFIRCNNGFWFIVCIFILLIATLSISMNCTIIEKMRRVQELALEEQQRVYNKKLDDNENSFKAVLRLITSKIDMADFLDYFGIPKKYR